ncbi:MAG: transposase [Pseudanabaena sp. CAN_BIN31]|nr:transposase [Pseudanabaena sp. CAN_BIN31]
MGKRSPFEGSDYEQLQAWIKKAHSVYGKVLETITTHLDGICNYFSCRITSGVMAGLLSLR